MKFTNKVVVITIGGSGIGRACAIAFAKAGADIVIADINITGAIQTEKLVVAMGVNVSRFKRMWLIRHLYKVWLSR
ncbi:MAG: hypothetical protein QM802_18105 [Agriterribacter sp.]